MTAGAFPFEANPNPVDPAERAARLTDPGFGRVFTDHMVTIRTPRAGMMPKSDHVDH